ncbi:TetR/AcrR family transcriptional regulator [Pseudooceanicola aestuarii]|uniref:TetR/AcrR family transcriptional regulator n=1 Tax=Pseudooceanicola aestuarii TaxID=2697319 RepID=UPI0013D0E66F|nr:TetR/AcrR family transcriptional regulator [Pseudooceanicola aestuarii]
MARARPYDRDTALDAALSLFWRKGYHATSLKDLEGALNMRPGSIYAAFHSKEDLYLASLERYFDRNSSQLQDLLERSGSPLGALANHLRSFARPDATSGHRACMLVKTLLDVTEADTAIADRARGYMDAMTELFTAFFDKAQAMGELPQDANTAQLARRYQADVTALRIEAQRGGDPGAFAALAEGMARDVARLGQAPQA